jgi:cobalt/nickel transport system permease protein
MLAMHAPDGFIEAPVALVMAVLSGVVLVKAVRVASTDLGDRQVPLAGITAAFVFAAQMVNFPVASGTTGHLLGGCLAAILLGPWVGTLVVAVVIVVQGLVFADGGLSALGINVMNMAIVPAFAGWTLFRLFRRMLPANTGGVIGATGLAAGMSVVLGSMAFSLEWLFGASAPVPFDTVFASMVGVHVVIGIGEGVISALVVAAVLAARPDLVAGAADLPAARLEGRARVSRRTFVIGGVLAAAFFAVVVSQFAASGPDGLERVADDTGFADTAEVHPVAGGLFADYATEGIDNETLSLAVAGLAGVALTLLVGWGLVSASRQAGRRERVAAPTVDSESAPRDDVTSTRQSTRPAP